MEASFWHERWATQQIGFHLDRPNPLLVKHAAVLGTSGRVLVPLCGKSRDLAWLALQGHHVIGVELSELAARAFFDEHQLDAAESTLGPFKRFAAGAVEILCGDFFALDPSHLAGPDGAPITAVYDRAALIALPKPMREAYARRIRELVPKGASILLITFEHAGSGDSGPPFSVPSAEVRGLYGQHFELTEIERNDVLEQEPRFKERGITALFEVAYALCRL